LNKVDLLQRYAAANLAKQRATVAVAKSPNGCAVVEPETKQKKVNYYLIKNVVLRYHPIQAKYRWDESKDDEGLGLFLFEKDTCFKKAQVFKDQKKKGAPLVPAAVMTFGRRIIYQAQAFHVIKYGYHELLRFSSVKPTKEKIYCFLSANFTSITRNMVALFLSTMPEERSADSGTAPAELKLTPVKVSLPLCLKHGTEEKFTAFIDCDVCPKCFIDCYRPDHCRQFFAYDMDPDDSSRPRWWQRGFVCAFGRLMFHLEHDSNKDTFFVTHWSREDDDGPSVKLAPNVKYLLHIGMSRRGMHYAVLVFILASRTVIVYEGIGYKLDTWIPEVELVLKKFGFMRDKVQISEVRTEHSFDCNWTLERGSTIVEQTGDHNCGPIACCTLWYLLTLGDKHFGKWDGMKISSKYRDDAELRRDMVERYLEMQEKAEIYCPRKSKWVMLNLDETSPEYEAAKSIIGNANVAPPATASLPVSCTVELLGNTSPSGSTERPGSYTNGQSVTICDGPPPPPKSTTKMAPPPPPPREKEAPSVQDLAATASNKSKSSQESPLLNPPANQNILKVKSGQQPQFPNRAAPKQIEDSVLLHSQKVQQKVTDTVDLLSQHDESKIISQLSSLQPPRLPDAKLSSKGLVDGEEVEWTEDEHGKERKATKTEDEQRKATEAEDEQRKARESEAERKALAAQTKRKAKEEEKQRNVEVAKTRRKATAEREEQGRKRKAEEESKEKAELAENKFNKRETNAKEAKQRKLEEERKKKAEKDAMLSRKGLVDDEEVEWTEKEHDKEDKQRRAKEAVAKKRKAGEEKKRKAMEDETKRKVREEEEERKALAAQTERNAKEEEKQRNVEVAKTRRNAKVAEKKRNLEEEEERKRKAEEVLPSKGLLNGDEVKEEKKRKATAEREEKGRKRKAEEERKEKAELAENKFNKRETNAMEAKKRKLEEERKKKAEKDAMLSRKGLVDDEEVEWTEKEHDKEDKQRRAKETVAKKRKAGEEKKRKAMEDETRRKVREEEDEKKKKAMKEREEEERKRNEKEEGKRKAEEESKRKKEKMEAEEEKKRKAKEKEERDKVLLRLMALGYIRDSYNEYKKTREVIMDSCEHVLMVPHIDMKNCCKACYFLWMGQCCRLCLPDTEEKRLKWAEFFSQNPETLKDKYKPGLSTLRYWNDLLGKAEKDDPPHYSTWGHWGPDVIKSFMTFVMHEFHPGDVQVEYWDDDTAGYGDWECWRLFEWTRYLLVIVKRNDNHSLYVIDVDHGKCSIVDPAIQAKRSSHVQVIMKILSKHYLIPGTNVGQPRLVMMDDPITEEETNKPPFPRMSPTSVVSLRESKYRIPRRIVVPFQVTLNEEKYQPIFCAGNCWMSGPTTIVNFVATLFRLELTHDIAFHREQTRVALIKNQWRGGLLDSTGKLFDKWVGPMTLPSLLNGLCVQRHCDDILEYCTGTLLKTFLDGKTLQQLQPKDAQTARRIQYESKDFAADWEKKTRSSGSEWNAITGELVHAWRSEMERRKDLWETKQLNK
jgi:hypothetical protein